MSVPRIALPALDRGVEIAAARCLVRELVERGYAYVRHPALPPDFLRAVKQSGRRVLATSSAEKERCAAPASGFRGFYQYVGASGSGDQIQCFSLGAPADSADAALGLRRGYYEHVGWAAEDMVRAGLDRANPWPDDVAAEDQRLVSQYRDVLATDLTHVLLNHISAGIEDAFGRELPELWHAGGQSAMAWAHGKGDGNLEVKMYPAATTAPTDDVPKVAKINRKVLRGRADASAATPPPSLGDAPPKRAMERLSTHQDLSSVTILAQDAMGGLEVLDTATDRYVAVPVLEDAVLVNAGVFMERWTEGRIAATPHRVRNTTTDATSRDRCSIVYFAFPDFDSSTAPLLAEDRSRPADQYQKAGDLHPLT